MPAGSREPYAGIGVLVDVVGVPAADGVEDIAAEVVGRAAERDGELEALERRQDAVEQRRIFDGELPREPACARVVDVEARLQEAELAGLRHQRGKRAAG